MFNSKKKYYRQILITILLIFIIMSLLIDFVIALFAYNNIAAEMNYDRRSMSVRFFENMDTKINIAVSHIQDYRNSEAFVNLAISGENDLMKNAYEVYRVLTSNSTVYHEMGISVGVIVPKYKISVFSDGFNNIDISKLDINYENLSLTSYNYVNTGGIIPTYEFSDREGAMFVINQLYSGEYQICFGFIIKDLGNPTVTGNENYILSFNGITALESNSKFGMPKKIYEIQTAYSAGGSSPMAYRAKSSVLSFVEYLYCFENSKIGFGIVSKCIGIVIFMIFLGFGVANIIARKLYAPVHELVQSVSKTFDSNFEDEFFYVSDSIQNMHNLIADLSVQNEKHVVIIKERLLRSLCTGTITNSEAERYIDEYDLEILKGGHYVVLIEVYDCADELAEDLTIQKKFIALAFERKIIHTHSTYWFFLEKGRTALIISDTDKEWKQKLKSILPELGDICEASMVVAVGSFAQNYTKTDISYRDAAYVLNNCNFLSGTYLYDVASVKKAESSIYYPIEVESCIIDSMVGMQPQKGLDWVEKIIDINLENKISIQHQSELKLSLSMTLNRIFAALDISPDEVFGENAVLYLEMSTDDKRYFKEKIMHVFKTMAQSLPGANEENNEIICRIVEYIDKNIVNDISLQDLAEYLNLSTWHVSRMFKNVLNQNFKSYVAIRRVEMAKELLRKENKLSISELALRVGCNNTVTLTRLFKKYTGMTPGEYRKQL